jgi:hypothetical protein
MEHVCLQLAQVRARLCAYDSARDRNQPPASRSDVAMPNCFLLITLLAITAAYEGVRTHNHAVLSPSTVLREVCLWRHPPKLQIYILVPRIPIGFS